MPRLVMVGVSHHLTPLEVRECLAFDAERWYARSPRGLPSVLVSTCNRVEVYAWVTGRSAPAVRALQRSLAEAAGLAITELQPYLAVFTGPEALLHLVRVAAGLDSLVVGEDHDLRTDQPLPLHGGLTGALASLATGLESRTGSQVRLSLADEPDIAPSTKVTLFRIAREALHNSEKHARATHVDLVLEVGPTEVTLLVADNGRGFDLWESHPGHFGLHMMREHAMAIAGGFEVVSAPGRGTRVRIRVVRRRQ